MGNLSNSTQAPQHLPASPVTAATGEEKQGWGHSLLHISGKSLLEGGFNNINHVNNMIYMFMKIRTAMLCVEQKTAESPFPLPPSGPFTTNQRSLTLSWHQAGKSKLTTHTDPSKQCRNQGSLRAAPKSLLHYGAARKLKNKQ